MGAYRQPCGAPTDSINMLSMHSGSGSQIVMKVRPRGRRGLAAGTSESFEFCSGPGITLQSPGPAATRAIRRARAAARPGRRGPDGREPGARDGPPARAAAPGRPAGPGPAGAATEPRAVLIFTDTRHRTSLHNFQLTLHTDSGRALPFRYGLWSNRHDAPLSGHDLCLLPC